MTAAAEALFQKLLDTGLPLAPRLAEICAALERETFLVLRADPGSGKSTLVPLALMAWADREGAGQERRPEPGKILLLESRRAAALSLAERMAELLGEKTGERAGYAVRSERKVSPRTRIEVLTEGLLVRRLQGDPELRAVSTVIFDEFHERTVHADLALALLLDLRRMGSPLRILLMSATLDAPLLAALPAAFLADTGEGGRISGGAAAADKERLRPPWLPRLRSGRHGHVNVPAPPSACLSATPPAQSFLIDCPGRSFPVEITYRPPAPGGRPGRDAALALAAILGEEPSGGENRDVLVFLPGRREIAEAAGIMEGLLDREDFEVKILHGSLPLSRQKEITAGAGRGKKRRIVLSTSLAETALTIPGIGLVVDSGLARLERYHYPSGLNRLVTGPENQSSAEQRAGRAGRLGPGRCVRLWAEGDRRPEGIEPEIRRTDLSAPVLECLIWGVRERSGLPWLEEPSPAAWSAALELLQNLGAADADARPTPRGREMARLGLEVRLAALCLAGKEASGGKPEGSALLGCASAALLAGRDGSGIAGDGDFRRRLALLRRFGEAPKSLSPEERAWAAAVEETGRDLLARLFPGPFRGRGSIFSWDAAGEADAGELLAAAFPDRICRRQEAPPGGRETGGVFRFPSGREGRIEGPLEKAEWLVAALADAGERQGFIRLAAPLSKETALAALAPWTAREEQVLWQGLVPRTVLTLRAGKILLTEERRKSRREEAARDLQRLLTAEGLSLLPWEGEPRRLLERIRFFAARRPAGSWDEGALTRDAEEWLGPFLWDGAGGGDGPVLSGPSLVRALEARLGWELKGELDRLVPARFTLPGGKQRPLDYGTGEPVLSLRLQDAFGIRGDTAVLSVPLTFELLSPAGRPVQITRDLPGFWAGSYAEVRRELRGRYPRHFWPETPGKT